MIHSVLIEPLSRAATALAGRTWSVRAVMAANVALALLAVLLLNATGAYAMEHESNDSVLATSANVAMAGTFVAGLVMTGVAVTGRPRRLSARRLELAVAGAVVVWPSTCLLLVLAAALRYTG